MKKKSSTLLRSLQRYDPAHIGNKKADNKTSPLQKVANKYQQPTPLLQAVTASPEQCGYNTARVCQYTISWRASSCVAQQLQRCPATATAQMLG